MPGTENYGGGIPLSNISGPTKRITFGECRPMYDNPQVEDGYQIYSDNGVFSTSGDPTDRDLKAFSMHNNGMNWNFVDGHVEFLNYGFLLKEWSTNDTLWCGEISDYFRWYKP